MELISIDDFLEWARALGISTDARYTEPRCLAYFPYQDHSRFWKIPDRSAGIPAFLNHLLDALERWSHIRLWPRGGKWPEVSDEPSINDLVRGTILGAAGVPSGHEGAAEFDSDERAKVLTAIFAQIAFGWTTRDDVFIVPDHARYLLYVDHHEVVHVEFRNASDIEPFIEHMASSGYLLPDEVPDWTFKKPSWMP